MSLLRSRWTVVALVPAFFLAGFGIVSALAGGSPDSGPSAGPGASTEEADPPVVTVYQETLPTETTAGGGSGETAAANPTDGGDGATTGGNGDGGNGGAPPAPAPGGVAVDYGRWAGVFELAHAAVVPDFGIASVAGELFYRGGVDCPVGLVMVRFWLYGEDGQVVGRGVWQSTDSTGEGAEVTGREPLPFEAAGEISNAASSAALRFTAVECL